MGAVGVEVVELPAGEAVLEEEEEEAAVVVERLPGAGRPAAPWSAPVESLFAAAG